MNKGILFKHSAYIVGGERLKIRNEHQIRSQHTQVKFISLILGDTPVKEK